MTPAGGIRAPLGTCSSCVLFYVTGSGELKRLTFKLKEFRKIAVSFLGLSLPGHYRVTAEALLAETT